MSEATRRNNPERAEFIREEMRQTGCLASEAARRYDAGARLTNRALYEPRKGCPCEPCPSGICERWEGMEE